MTYATHQETAQPRSSGIPCLAFGAGLGMLVLFRIIVVPVVPGNAFFFTLAASRRQPLFANASARCQARDA